VLFGVGQKRFTIAAGWLVIIDKEEKMKILIATDGSEFSDAAVEKICQMVKNVSNTEVKIVSAYEQPIMVAAAPYAIPAGYNPVLETEIKELAAQAVSSAEKKIRERFPDLKANLTTQILSGSPQQTIVEEAENWNADLIVVGSHGYGFWERAFLGSVSNAVVNHAPCSVLVVRKTQHHKEELEFAFA
jgi:nucleotide-binding universal stress UspA family protein